MFRRTLSVAAATLISLGLIAAPAAADHHAADGPRTQNVWLPDNGWWSDDYWELQSGAVGSGLSGQRLVVSGAPDTRTADRTARGGRPRGRIRPGSGPGTDSPFVRRLTGAVHPSVPPPVRPRVRYVRSVSSVLAAERSGVGL